ncbi:MAG: hypothetical protein PHN31_07025 [Candidatus Gracilibacteria bacterium]|nr:hypothetical protein [Candidatus Gracilibacteria bacterium]
MSDKPNEQNLDNHRGLKKSAINAGTKNDLFTFKDRVDFSTSKKEIQKVIFDNFKDKGLDKFNSVFDSLSPNRQNLVINYFNSGKNSQTDIKAFIKGLFAFADSFSKIDEVSAFLDKFSKTGKIDNFPPSISGNIDTAIEGFPGAADFIGKERIKDYKDVDDTVQKIFDDHMAIQKQILAKEQKALENNKKIIDNNKKIINKNTNKIKEIQEDIEFLNKLINLGGGK